MNKQTSMITINYCPILGCTGWELRAPFEDLDQKKKRSRDNQNNKKWTKG
tara:strand:+ start:1089 stop:1238 length:150 start_codon:yes stop_codon:yes gene_type:complete